MKRPGGAYVDNSSDEDGKPQNVFIFQGDRYIDQVERVETYNRVMAEQTDDDKRKFYRQQKKVRQFMKFVGKGVEETPTIGIQKKQELNKISDYEQEKTKEEVSPPPNIQALVDEECHIPDTAKEVPPSEDRAVSAVDDILALMDDLPDEETLRADARAMI